MANYLTTDTDLTSVANAIRAKGGTSAQLAFPADFVSAVNAIPTGGSGEWTSDGVASNAEPNGDVVLTGTTIATYALYYRPIVTLRGNSVTSTGAYGMCNMKSLKRVTLPNVTNVSNQFFNGCSALENIYADSFPKLQSFGQQALRGCSSLGVVVLPSFKASGAWQCITNNGMHTLDLGGTITTGASISSDALQGNTNLNKIILRYTAICTLSNISGLNNTPFASGKAGGTLYVPSSLIASYQAASNWSTILGYATNQIKSIESTHTDPDAPIDLTLYYADGTPLPT